MGLCCCKDDTEAGRRWPTAGSHLLAGKDAPFDPRSPNAAAGLTRTPYQGVAAGMRRREGAAGYDGAAAGPSQLGGGRTGAFQPVKSSNNQLVGNDPDVTGHGAGMYGSAPPNPGHTASGSL